MSLCSFSSKWNGQKVLFVIIAIGVFKRSLGLALPSRLLTGSLEQRRGTVPLGVVSKVVRNQQSSSCL
ncbi:hypothetical protein HanHA89_Chr03g0102231 [Helianthus annuus]|nr:hypothetical protein HanHA89_Chr03g0102231 [Helianthus annuus]